LVVRRCSSQTERKLVCINCKEYVHWKSVKSDGYQEGSCLHGAGPEIMPWRHRNHGDERMFMTTLSASALRDCNCYGLIDYGQVWSQFGIVYSRGKKSQFGIVVVSVSTTCAAEMVHHICPPSASLTHALRDCNFYGLNSIFLLLYVLGSSSPYLKMLPHGNLSWFNCLVLTLSKNTA
jgi:hypothetical protein